MTRRAEYLPFGKPNFSDEEIEAVTHVLKSGWVGMGRETLEFEAELAAYLDVPHVVTVDSCTSALFLSLVVQGVGPDDEVICPSLTWCSTANVALYLGATPVFGDVDPATLCLTPETVQAKLTSKTKAVIVVHFGGYAADVDAIRAVLPPHVALIEDAAHALGSRFANDTAVGASGNLTCFSFYANKNLSTGEGGAIALHNDEQAERLRSLRQHGLATNAWNRFQQPKSKLYTTLNELGYKMNYTDLQAAIGRVQLRRQPTLQAHRLEIARLYHDALAIFEPDITLQTAVTHPHHARHLFTITLPLDKMSLSRDDLILKLRDLNIGASIHYAPLHKMPLYNHPIQHLLPVTDRLSETILTLPISASMNSTDAHYVLHHFCNAYLDATCQYALPDLMAAQV